MIPANAAFYGTPLDEEEYLKKRFADLKIPVTAAYNEHCIGPDNLPPKSDISILGIFVDSKVDAAVMDCFPNLKLIVTLSTGFDHIDLAETKKRGITVSTVPSYGENTVAEFAFGLILMLSRKLYQSAERTREKGDFETDQSLRGFDLSGRTIGVIGTGKIGRHSIAMAKGFDMKVLAYDPYPNEKLAKDMGFEYVTLDGLLSQSDIVTIHVPYMKETHHLIDAEALSKMKPTALVINTSRGAVVDTDALVKALNEKRLAGAGLDVLEDEPDLKPGAPSPTDPASKRMLSEDHELMRMPNVVVTPHNAFNTDEALKRILDTTVDNIAAWLSGKPTNTVA
ncbi:MAG: hydroxyacid dehydrogenase [Patescibacteria group bacterium]|nr:hydroxyacid dehydrogenase [Patescibacteria group bacterium]